MEQNPYIMSLITQIGVIITAIFGFITAVIQLHSNNKAKKSEDILQKVYKKIDKNQLSTDRRYLVDFMERVERGEELSDEQIQCAFEVKQEYNSLGGNSYVDTKWNLLIDKGILKIV